MSAPTGLARVTVKAPHRRVDVALPDEVPLADLLPELLRHAGDGLADDGEQHGGWVLRRPDGAALAPAQGLSAQGVRDGEVLYLVPAQAEWPEPDFDDVVEAIAAGARRQGAAWSARATRLAGVVFAGAPLLVGLGAVLHGGQRWTMSGRVGLGVATILLVAAIVASRAYGDGAGAGVIGGFALAYAFAGGALLVGTGGRPGVLGALGWLGESQLLVGCAGLMLAAVLGAVGVGASRRVVAAGVTVGLLGALTAVAGIPLSAAAAAAGLVAVLVCGIGVLPLLAIRFGRLPMPPPTLPIGVGADDLRVAGGGSLAAARERPDRTRVFTAVDRAEEVLTGMLVGHALLCLAGGLVLVVAGGSAGLLLVAVGGVALLLRSRLFVSVRQRLPLMMAGTGLLVTLALDLLLGASDRGLLGVVIAAVLLSLVMVAAGATYSHRSPSPYLVRAADMVDTILVISVIPVACAVLGLYGRVRGLAG